MSMFDYFSFYWDWADANQDKHSPTLAGMYFYFLRIANDLHWKDSFSITSTQVMDCLGIGNYKTYKKHFDLLVENGLIKVVKPSINQYSANVVAMVKNTKAHGKASTKHVAEHVQSTSHIHKTLKTNKDIEDNTHTPKKSKPNNKHLWKDSKYFQNPELFCADWYLTPRSNEDRNIDPMVVYATINEAALSHEYKYANWIQAAANWTRKNPNRFYSGILQHVPKIVADFAARNADHTNGGIDPTTGRPWES